ncbi:MAG TPA: dTMP kinase [Mycobacteriales bacterium]|nr:dTMP kinase [Mycobacteriales bacterium]
MQSLSWPGALAYRGFRRLALALVLSSFGDWLAFLATTALASQLVDGFGAKSFAVGGVLAFRLLPSVVLAPFVGVIADRLDRRLTMVVSDLLRFVLFLSIPLVDSLTWLLIATALVEVLSLVWIPAKESSVPHLAKDRLESANQVSLFATYGTAPLAALVFGVLGVLSIRTNQSAAHLALYVNAATFAFAAVQVFRIHEIPTREQVSGHLDSPPTVVASIREGLRFAHTSGLVRGLLVGMLGALAATGTVVGNGKLFTETILDGGEAAFALLFGSVFVGIALGVALGPRMLRGMSRRRAFGPAITGAGLSLCFMSVVPVLALVVFAVVLLGSFAGIAYVLGLTLLGGEVEDSVRGRTFGLVNSLMRISLLLSVAAAPALAGAIGVHRYGELDVNGVSVTLFAGGLLAMAVGLMAYRTMNDLPGVPLRHDLVRLVSRRVARVPSYPGLFVVFEGGEGAGKSTQVQQLAEALRAVGYDVVVTREPGATDVGARIRSLLLDPATRLSPRAEALLYAADRAQHVAEVVRPALARGAVVISDRYVDSSLAYQGAGRELDAEEVAELSRWATHGLRPALTVLLDVDPQVGLGRATGSPDRIEQEALSFHQAVRQGFLDLAAAEPHRYLVLGASQPQQHVHEAVLARVTPLLPERVLAPA